MTKGMSFLLIANRFLKSKSLTEPYINIKVYNYDTGSDVLVSGYVLTSSHIDYKPNSKQLQ